MASGSGFKKALKFSCLGCLGIFFLVMFTLLLVGWVAGKNATFTEADAGVDAERIRSSSVLTPEEIAVSPDLSAVAAKYANRLELKIVGIDKIKLRPCELDEGLSVKADYNENSIEFHDVLVEEEDGRWAYKVEMLRQGGDMAHLLERIFSGRESTLEVCLPAEVPIELIADVRRGGIEAELGGLWLPKIDLTLDRGGAAVSIDEPLRAPAQSFSINATMGGAALSGLGNASPAELNLDYRFGGFSIDMTGAWQRDALITMQGMASGVSLNLPRNVNVEGVPDLAGSAIVEGAPTLTFAPGVDWDDVEVQRPR